MENNFKKLIEKSMLEVPDRNFENKVMDKDYFPEFPTEEEYVRVKDLRSAVEGLKADLDNEAFNPDSWSFEIIEKRIDKWLKCWGGNNGR